MLAWLSVWSEVQTCIWPSWCHCQSLPLAPVKSRLVLPFWYWLTRVVPDKGLLNGCVCVCVTYSNLHYNISCWLSVERQLSMTHTQLQELLGTRKNLALSKKTFWGQLQLKRVLMHGNMLKTAMIINKLPCKTPATCTHPNFCKSG